MGRGDFKTKRGKITRGSFGNSRPNPSKVRAAGKKKKAWVDSTYTGKKQAMGIMFSLPDFF